MIAHKEPTLFGHLVRIYKPDNDILRDYFPAILRYTTFSGDLPLYRRFFAGISDIDKRNIRRKQDSVGFNLAFCAHHLDKIFDRCRTNPRAIHRKT
jgi:hypothetical protein